MYCSFQAINQSIIMFGSSLRLHRSFSLGAQPEAALEAEAEGERATEQPAAAPPRQPHHHRQETLTRHGR